ncbi:Sodium-coupled neutral amino acid transporter 4 [Merluccius polli]|uniref:Sodium-coupled neutral amino acid transporter 4 n=1 Tax=Merluccius polli TaxID=89951 RepID=A0AA47M3N4_MERPO|nr:Sodium-coupled neutral amino acid transporter 4 [Merluccius polli]
MPGVLDRMELSKVSTAGDDDDSTNSLDDTYPEKASQFTAEVDDDDDRESHKFLANGMMDKKKRYEEEYHPGHTSFGMSVFNLSNAIMGSGILGLSYAMANTGILLFSILLVGVAILSLYSVHLLLMTAKEGGSLIYEKLGERAFGWPGKMAAFISITMQNIGAMSSYLFIVKYELPEVIRAFMGLEESNGEWYMNGNYLVVMVTIAIILPLSLLKNLGYLGYTSGFSLSCMVFFVGVLIYKKTHLPCPLPFFSSNMSSNASGHLGHLGPLALHNDSVHHLDFSPAGVSPSVDADAETCTPKYLVFNSQTAYTVPILAFAFVCHPEVLPIYSELKDRSRKKMQRVSNLSIFAMLIMYFLSALFGYLTFYEHVEAELLHTFTKVYKFDTMLLLVRLAVLTAVTLTVPIVLFPNRHKEEILMNCIDQNKDKLYRPNVINDVVAFLLRSARPSTPLLFSGRVFSWIRHLIIAAVILLFNNLLVIFVPTIRDIFGFIGKSTGSSAATMLIFILPAAFYLRLVKSVPFRSPQKIGALIFLIVGIVFMIGSLSLIAMDWIYNPPAPVATKSRPPPFTHTHLHHLSL